MQNVAWFVEQTLSRGTDYIGAAVRVAGAGIILYGARRSAT